MSDSTLGILVPRPEEAQALFALMEQNGSTETTSRGTRDYHRGQLFGRPCILALSRIGKVAAATTAVSLIHDHRVSAILNIGVAGGIGDGVEIGDIVIADEVLQHDLDRRPLSQRFEVPMTGLTHIKSDSEISNDLWHAAVRFFQVDLPRLPADIRQQFRLARPRVHRGLIVSGDQFISHTEKVASLRTDLPDALAIEMESGAVGQVCNDYGIPFAVLRIVSDRADNEAHLDFPAFLNAVASFYSQHILFRFCGGVALTP